MKRVLILLGLSMIVVPAAWAITSRAGVTAPYRPGEVLVKYRISTNAPAALTLKSIHGFQTDQSLLDGHAELLRLPSVMDVPAAIAMLSVDTAVEYAEPNFLRHKLSFTPNDPLFPQQWGLYNTGQANFAPGGPAGIPGGDFNAINAWDLDNDGLADHTGTGAVTVAVIDDAVETAHPDLAANMVAGYNFVDNNSNPNPASSSEGHGTSVAGCVAAIGNNGIGVAGAAWNEKIMPLKFGYDVATEVRAIQFARDHGARVVNASFGGPSYTRTEFDAISNLNDRGILYVASAGNENSNNDFAGAAYPANYQLPNIVAVAATNRQDNIASFSSYGSVTVPIAAPGLQIITTAPTTFGGSGYTDASISGTSFASPYTAGVAALIRDYFPAASVREVKARLIEGANAGLDPLTPAVLRTAGGRINAANSLSLAPRPSLVIRPVQTSSYEVNYGGGNIATVPVYAPVSIVDGGNGALDSGETTNISILIENLWLPATNVSGTLSASGGVTVNSGAVRLGDIASQNTASAIFNVSVPANITGHQYIFFTLDLTADGGYTASRHFIQEIGSLQNGVAVSQVIQADMYDEIHTWHFDVGALPAGANSLSFEAKAGNDVDIIVSYGAPAQYNVSLGATRNSAGASYFTNVPTAQVSGNTGGDETVTIGTARSGTYFVTVLNYDQRPNATYTLRATLSNTPPGGGGAMPPFVLLALLLVGLSRRNGRRGRNSR